MHEEATSMSVPCSVAASTTTQNQNGTTATVSVVTADVDLDITPENDNVDLQVPFSSNSTGKNPSSINKNDVSRCMIYRLVRQPDLVIYAFLCATNLF